MWWEKLCLAENMATVRHAWPTSTKINPDNKTKHSINLLPLAIIIGDTNVYFTNIIDPSKPFPIGEKVILDQKLNQGGSMSGMIVWTVIDQVG
jgi:hypothetical protein